MTIGFSLGLDDVERTAEWGTRVVTALEIFIGLLIMSASTRRLGRKLAIAILMIYTVSLGLQIRAAGGTATCGCQPLVGAIPVWAAVTRNVILLVVLLGVSGAPSGAEGPGEGRTP